MYFTPLPKSSKDSSSQVMILRDKEIRKKKNKLIYCTRTIVIKYFFNKASHEHDNDTHHQ